MYHALLFPLVFALVTLSAPAPAPAQTFAECQAYLCLPAGFSTHGGTPSNACAAAKVAVERRVAAGLPALPPWADCAARFGWDAANLNHTEPRQYDCPSGGTATGGTCRYTDANGCTWSYTARERVTVQVVVDGSTNFQPNHTHQQVVQNAGTPALDPPGQDPLFCSTGQPQTCQQLGTCPPPTPGACPVSGPGPGAPPAYQIVDAVAACPPGYPFTWTHAQPACKYCLLNPGRP